MLELSAWIHEVSQAAYCREETLWMTYTLTRHILARKVPGDLVECGVAAGVQPAVMARACIDVGEARRIHLCDTFDGIPAPGPRDGPEAKQIEGLARHSKEQVLENLLRWFNGVPWVGDGPCGVRFAYHEGLFEATLPKIAGAAHILDRKLCLLRLDGDLYSGTKAALENLERLLSPNGVLIVDDGLAGVRKAVREYFGERDDFAPLMWQKGQK